MNVLFIFSLTAGMKFFIFLKYPAVVSRFCFALLLVNDRLEFQANFVDCLLHVCNVSTQCFSNWEL